jgi:hypothetical protein
MNGHENIHKMEYYSAIMKNEILSFVVKWMELGDIMLSEISQTQKDKYHKFSLPCENERKDGRKKGRKSTLK